MGALRTIALDVTLDGRRADSETTCTWAGPYVLVIATVLPELGLAVDVHSTFVGHEGVPTCATHLTLGPVGHDPVIVLVETRAREPRSDDQGAGVRLRAREGRA